jgi:hypothetical protein
MPLTAKHDANERPLIICVSSVDGKTIVPIYTDGGLNVDDAHTGSDVGNNDGNAMMDENSVACWTALSSANDGTVVQLYGNPLNNKLLIDSH